MQSPYFTPPKRASPSMALPSPPETPTKAALRTPDRAKHRSKRARPMDNDDTSPSTPRQGLRRSTRLSAGKTELPPTPESSSKRSSGHAKEPQDSARMRKRKRDQRATVAASWTALGELTVSDDLALGPIVLQPAEDGLRRTHLPKVVLAQDKLRHDPWKLLVMTTLLNKTAGRAVRPIFEQLVKQYPTPLALSQASVPDLANLLFPLGLFNQRAASLIRFSSQYLSLGWPTSVADGSRPLPDPDANGRTRYALDTPLPPVEALDVNVFYGSGLYASDSFRIYSPLLPGGGGPAREREWMEKRERAEERVRYRIRSMIRPTTSRAMIDGAQEDGLCEADTVEVDEALSDAEDDGEEEWRKVIAGDKELRRYLRWRWAIEGIEYDYERGPLIKRERDRRRLAWLL